MSSIGLRGASPLRSLASRRLATPAAVERLEHRLLEAIRQDRWTQARRLIALRRTLPIPDEKTRRVLVEMAETLKVMEGDDLRLAEQKREAGKAGAEPAAGTGGEP